MSESKKDVNDLVDMELLKNLSEIRGCAGHEDNVRSMIKKIISPYCDEVKTDIMGNLYGIKYGKNKDNSIMLAAHMDEVGFMVRYIDKDGFVRVAQVGGQNIRLLPGSRVLISGEKGDVPGIFGEKAIHLIKSKDRDKVTALEDAFVDIGMPNKEEAEKYISIGDYIEFEQIFQHFPNTTIVNGKSLDDRVGCFVLIEAMKRISKLDKPEQTIIFGFTTQEEIGTRGATIAGNVIKPTSALVLEVTHGIDYPSVNKATLVDIDLGKGPSIAVGPNLHPKISRKLIDIAKKDKIPFQVEPENRPTGTDARSIQITGSGIPVGLVSIPLRYMHTMIETIDIQDVASTIDLITNYLSARLSKNYNLK